MLNNCIVSAGAVVKAGAHLARTFLAPDAVVEEDATYADRYISQNENLPIIF
jgi:ADP-glucose pyrophosphorylase